MRSQGTYYKLGTTHHEPRTTHHAPRKAEYYVPEKAGDNKEFKLAVDASDVGAGGVLLQEDDNGVDHPICYFSKKFSKHQKNYSSVEKECLSLILALQHFEVYLTSSSSPFVVFSDHNPLNFIYI